MIIKTKAYPRAGLIGNPSDGYFGKTISFCFSNFAAEVILYQTPELEILPNTRDNSVFKSVSGLVDDVRDYGYYGGIRLLKATVKRFSDYCSENRIVLDRRNFTMKYHSNIPHRVGLAGSSAIITAAMRALMSFYQVTIPRPVLAGLILSVERDELQISAGLQDRVAQVYEGLVYMDFERKHMEMRGCGIYEPLSIDILPRLYIAYRTDLSEGSEVFHNSIRERFERGEKLVVDAMKYWAGLTGKMKSVLKQGNTAEIAKLINANFDRRRKIYRLSQDDIDMVEIARNFGSSAKFTGSGGAIVGTYEDEKTFAKMKKAFAEKQIRIIKPRIRVTKEKVEL